MQEYVCGYTDWQRQGHHLAVTDGPEESATIKRAAAALRKDKKKTKLSYKEQRELNGLAGEIESLETNIAALQEIVAAPGFYSQDNEVVQRTLQELSKAERLLEQRVERWGELESMQESLQSS